MVRVLCRACGIVYVESCDAAVESTRLLLNWELCVSRLGFGHMRKQWIREMKMKQAMALSRM